MKPIILHISNDFPDPYRPDKTQAIANLIAATPEFRHIIYSLNRVNGIGGLTHRAFGEDRTAIAYGALPKGLFWKPRLLAVARWVIADLAGKNITPNIIQAHKFTVEGIAGLALSRHFNCPLICDIQGGSDVRILKATPLLRPLYREIAARAAVIFPYAPWAIAPFQRAIGLDAGKCVNLPVLPGFDALAPSESRGQMRLVTLMRLRDHKNKNLRGLLAAMRLLMPRYPALTLDIYGSGDPADHPLPDYARFKGPVANHTLPHILGSYTALAMPSFSETYGLSYAEALFCGIPVLFSEGRAIDGYFNTDTIGYACNPASSQSIAAGIAHLIEHENTLKEHIAHMQKTGALDTIRREAILKIYRAALLSSLQKREP